MERIVKGRPLLAAMRISHYQNCIDRTSRKVSPSEAALWSPPVLLDGGTLEERLGCQEMEICTKAYQLRVNGSTIPIATGKKNGGGTYAVVEKWENPYWKNPQNEMVWTPGPGNPIGQHLIILADLETRTKVSTGIHAWPYRPQTPFRQGPYGTGCVRIRQEDMPHLFQKIELGAIIAIR